MQTNNAGSFDFSVLPRRKVLWLLFREFFLISTFVVGGGYAIALAAEREFCQKLHWMKEEEMPDMLSISQTIPGLIAGNVAIYIGNRAAGPLGALVALTAIALPSFLVILLVSMVFTCLPMTAPHVQGAFTGVRAALAGLTAAALLKLGPKVLTRPFSWIIAIGCVLLILGLQINPGWVLGGAIISGILWLWFTEAVLKRPGATLIPPGGKEGKK